MKISYNWLRHYVDTDISAEEMATILTETGLEVEGVERIETVKGGLDGVVVAEVLSCEKHPDADKLKVTKVTYNDEVLQVVCGAPNVAAGQKVLLATVGTTLYPKEDQPLKIKISTIRGVESHGMLCAEDELGIGASHDGILVLDPSIPRGISAAELFEIEQDFQIEIGLTPNRADAMGHIGVARDLIAYLNFHKKENLKLSLPSVDSFHQKDNHLLVSIEVDEPDLCPRYFGLTISNVAIKPSPAWLQNKLRVVGLTPINNVVDATNFVMRELGTPLHAFDLRAIGERIVVKKASKDQQFVTLDGIERKLTGEELMITNGKDNLCIAGVFGGQHSGIKEDTVDIFLESAYFDPVSIRKTAKSHGLHTDASFRFERGVDPALTEYALKRAALLIQEVAGGEIAMEIASIAQKPLEQRKVTFNYTNCNKLIGHAIAREEVNQLLDLLGIRVLSVAGDIAELEVPLYRVDVTREADIVEEVLRIYGFNKVPLPEKITSSMPQFPNPDHEKIQRMMSEMLVGNGMTEILNNSLTSSGYIEKLNGKGLKSENNVKMLNPLSQELDVLRQTLLFGALEVVEHNQNRQHPDLKLFEFGSTYHKFGDRYVENKRLLLLITGRKEAESWNSSNESHSFYTAKGFAKAVLQRLGLDRNMAELSLENSLYEDGIQLKAFNQQIGTVAWLSSEMKKNFGLRNNVFVVDFDWDKLMELVKNVKIKFTELPKTFAVRRDFSLLLDKSVKFSEIASIALNSEKKLLKEVGLFDVYEGKNLEEGKKSYAVSFIFQDAENTLKDELIDGAMEKIRISLEAQLNAQLR